jgi:hypothetical protein
LPNEAFTVLPTPRRAGPDARSTGFAVARLNPWLPLHRGSVLLEVTELAGDLWVGVVGRNFNPEGEWWSMPFFPPQDASTEEHKRYSKTQHISAVRASSGTVHVKGVEEVNAKLAPFGGPGQPKVLNLKIDVPAYELKMRLLQRDAKGDDTTTAEADLDNKMPELTVAVCFGEPTTPGARTSVRILGSSCERVETHQLKHRRNSRVCRGARAYARAAAVCASAVCGCLAERLPSPRHTAEGLCL